ncbi:hypothetical protein FGO68_gene1025 [Halteria grandinella]|uniref:Uncharacterized protein n=1 Tax=Halteria grandinella TaxID=5974 RepID=A0A8J8NDT0_HALGN|nr:hypothetical protein FGO68_gene1025 [Halteria grandinella]
MNRLRKGPKFKAIKFPRTAISIDCDGVLDLNQHVMGLCGLGIYQACAQSKCHNMEYFHYCNSLKIINIFSIGKE